MTETAVRTVTTVTLGPGNVEREAGMTYRQLDYAVRRGWLKPLHVGGTGNVREWTYAELAVARVMGRLTRAGLPAPLAASVARSGQARHEIAPGVVIKVTP